MAICTNAEYTTWAGISVTTYDTRLTALIPQLQARVETYCRRLFDYSASVTEVLDGPGGSAVILARAPIYSITSVTITTPDDSVDLDADDYDYDTDGSGRLFFVSAGDGRLPLTEDGFPPDPQFGELPRFPKGRGNVTVVYAGGYGTPNTAMPADLKLAFFEYLSEAMLISGPGGGGSAAGAAQGVLASKTLGRNSESYRSPKERGDRLQELFYPYRRLILG